jgi:hypothetical protein
MLRFVIVIEHNQTQPPKHLDLWFSILVTMFRRTKLTDYGVGRSYGPNHSSHVLDSFIPSVG